MRVLADYHHGNLYYSLHLLFEKRLGYELIRPIGHDWFDQGYFKIAEPYGNAEDTIGQYLSINDREWDSHKNLNGNYKLKDDIYHIQDPENGFQHNAVTFERFKQMKFDYIVATHPLHTNWEELLKYQPEAKFIQQVGNENQTSNATNILCSTADFKPEGHQNIIRYHQEFDVEPYEPPTNHNKITSFVVTLPEPEIYEQYKSALPEFEFKAHGVGSPDGTVSGNTIPQLMKENAFGYHIKPLDGFGHVIHKWAFSGRPLIVRASYYKGKIAEPLLIDGVTCIDLDSHTFEENIRLIRQVSEPERHNQMCEAMYKRAKEVCNFDKEASEIKGWLQTL